MQKCCGESVYQTNVAYGITHPVTGTGASVELSPKYSTEDVYVDVTPNEAYGVTSNSAGAQMAVCTADKEQASKHTMFSTDTGLYENDVTESYSYVRCEHQS